MSVQKKNSMENILLPGTRWLLNNNINGYKNIKSNELATEIFSGRKFEITFASYKINSYESQKRVRVKLLEDGYICWIELEEIQKIVQPATKWEPLLLSKEEIKKQIPLILDWIENTSKKTNYYLWGGTLGPNFDCSGLIQTAFSVRGIWIPRDSYQQEKFCRRIEFNKKTLEGVIPGDLLFFGNDKKCTHVAIYIGEGFYWHSSGKETGRDGIGKDTLKIISKNSISSYYQSILRGAGRIENCHDGTELD